MIVKSSWRRAGGLERHLLRTDTNEAVHVRTDLFRGADDLHAALRLMEAISRTNPRVQRPLVHVVVSPDHVLTEPELARTLTMIETEHGLSHDAPRAVVTHLKGARATHVHIAYPAVDVVTGKAVKSHGNFERDELLSRRLEIAFGERVTPGPRIVANVAALRRSGLDNEADRLAPYLPVRHEDGLSRADRQQASRLGLRAPEWSSAAFKLFERSDRDLAAFAGLLANAGLGVARGDKTILLVDDRTGYGAPLARLLRREAKASGRSLALSEAEVAAAFVGAPGFIQVRDDGVERARTRAERDLAAERRTAMVEAALDGDAAALDAFRRQARKTQEEEERSSDAARATLRARQQAIAAFYRERDELRRRRVDRAFRAARVIDLPELRRLAFALAAAGVLMTGGSLALAVGGGAVALGLLPTRARARAAAVAARRERAEDTARRRSEITAASEAARLKTRSASGFAHVRFTFDAVAKSDRVLAGLYVEELLQGGSLSVEARAARGALGPEVVAGLERMLERGSPVQVRLLRHWYRGIIPDRRSPSVEAALRRHGVGRTESRRTTGPNRTPPSRSKRGVER